jgi:hypothetical protein
MPQPITVKSTIEDILDAIVRLGGTVVYKGTKRSGEFVPLPRGVYTTCTHPGFCAETGMPFPGYGPDGAFVDVAGAYTPHQRRTGPTYEGPGPYTEGYDPDPVVAEAMAEDSQRLTVKIRPYDEMVAEGLIPPGLPHGGGGAGHNSEAPWDGNGTHTLVPKMVSGPLAARLIELDRLTKNKDAGYSGVLIAAPWQAYREAGAFGAVPPWSAALLRFAEKNARIKALLTKVGVDAVGESLRDTMMDAAAILLIAVDLLDEDDCVGCEGG